MAQNDGSVQEGMATTKSEKTVSTTQSAMSSGNGTNDSTLWVIVSLLCVAGICLGVGYCIAMRHKNKRISELEKTVTTQMSRIDTLSKLQQMDMEQDTRNRVPTLSIGQNEVTLEESKVSHLTYTPEEANIQNYDPNQMQLNVNNLKVIEDGKHGGETSGSFCSMKTDDIPNYKIEDVSNESDADSDMDIIEECVTKTGDDDGDDDVVIEDMNSVNVHGKEVIVTKNEEEKQELDERTPSGDIDVVLAEDEFVVSGDGDDPEIVYADENSTQ